jgi:hypothetical protein
MTLKLKGTVREAVERIASQGRINVVAVGNLEDHAELYLHDVTPEEALQTLARAYHLELEHEGNTWTVREPPPPPGGAVDDEMGPSESGAGQAEAQQLRLPRGRR